MIDLIKISVYKDGGTSVWVEASLKDSIKTVKEVQNCQKYYLDKRIFSETKGELFDRYPSKEGAIILDKSQFNFL